MSITLTIPGEPVGKGRPRLARNGRAFTPKKTREYEAKVRQLAHLMRRHKTDAMVEVDIVAVYTRPKARPKTTPKGMWQDTQPWHVGSFDADNIAKAVLDGLTPIIPDDRRVVRLTVEKRCGPSPHVRVTIREVSA